MFVIHFKKDLLLLFKSPSFIIFIVFWGIMVSLMIEFLSLNYASYVSDINLSHSEILEYQKETILNFWKNIGSLSSIFVLVIFSLFFVMEEENGMSSYIITYGVKPLTIYLSKLFTLIMISFLLSLTAWGLFEIIFYLNNNFLLFPTKNFLSSILLFLVMIVLTSIGGFIGVISKKRSVAVSISIFFMITTLYISSIGVHLCGDFLSQNYSTTEINHLSDIPLLYKIMVVINPIIPMEGVIPILNWKMKNGMFSISYVSLFGLTGDIIIAIFYTIIFVLMTIFIHCKRHDCFRGEAA